MKFLWLALVIALFCGCSTRYYEYRTVTPAKHVQHHQEIPIYVDRDFTYRERLIIYSVIKEWNHVLNGYIYLDIVDWKYEPASASGKAIREKIKIEGEGVSIIAINHDSSILKDQEEAIVAFVDNIGPGFHTVIVVQDRIGRADLHKILLHEFGHGLGAMHTSCASLMHPRVNHLQSTCIDKITASQVAATHHLDVNHMNYCLIPGFE